MFQSIPNNNNIGNKNKAIEAREKEQYFKTTCTTSYTNIQNEQMKQPN